MDSKRRRKHAKVARCEFEGGAVPPVSSSAWEALLVFLCRAMSSSSSSSFSSLGSSNILLANGEVWCGRAEVSSIEWEFINMTEQEEDLIYRMYRLVGDRWSMIAGRIPGRKPEEIERFWIMRHSEEYAEKRKQRRS